MIEMVFMDTQQLERFLRIDSAIVSFTFVLVSWVLYKAFLNRLSRERHRLLGESFRNIFGHSAIVLVCYVLFRMLLKAPIDWPPAQRLVVYFGFFVLVYGLVIFVKACRILIFEYLFLSHMKVPVPILLVNLFTFTIAVCLSVWVMSGLFKFQIAPLLATSAVFSLVLGLALQDTLGNLFAGISLQFDKSYEIGDWVEVHADDEKVLGQIQEITWRATLLKSFTDESITVPNRVMAKAQIYNYATRKNPVIRSLYFRVPYEVDTDLVKRTLVAVAERHPDVCEDPAPIVLLIEPHESWIGMKLVYYVTEFGRQFLIADSLLEACLKELRKAKVPLATARLKVEALASSPAKVT